jgi:triosephosphate isomerase
MHLGPEAARSFADRFASRLETDPVDANLVLFPSAIALGAVVAHTLGEYVDVGCQTVHPEPHGAFTGELAAEMAVEAGASWSLVGHSERRHIFGEDDAAVAARVGACLRAGLRPMVCVGETLEERRGGRLEVVLRRQVEAVLPHLGELPADAWAIAYEPVWAIGTGETASPTDAEEAHAFVARVLEEGGGPVPPILYGGSVKPGNAGELLAAAGVDGVLVGGASLDPTDFHEIARAAGPR